MPTIEDIDKTVTKVYYDDGNLFSRDKLFEVIKDKKLNITRAQMAKKSVFTPTDKTTPQFNQRNKKPKFQPTILAPRHRRHPLHHCLFPHHCSFPPHFAAH